MLLELLLQVCKGIRKGGECNRVESKPSFGPQPHRLIAVKCQLQSHCIVYRFIYKLVQPLRLECRNYTPNFVYGPCQGLHKVRHTCCLFLPRVMDVPSHVL